MSDLDLDTTRSNQMHHLSLSLLSPSPLAAPLAAHSRVLEPGSPALPFTPPPHSWSCQCAQSVGADWHGEWEGALKAVSEAIYVRLGSVPVEGMRMRPWRPFRLDACVSEVWTCIWTRTPQSYVLIALCTLKSTSLGGKGTSEWQELVFPRWH